MSDDSGSIGKDAKADKPSKKFDKDAANRVAKRRKARHYAVQALYQWQMAKQSLTDIEQQFRDDYDMTVVDTEYFAELVHKIPSCISELGEELEKHLDRALKDLTPVELAVMRIGVYELKYRIDVPYKVVINEAVNLAKRFGATESHRYVNGVLDKVAADTRQIEVSAR